MKITLATTPAPADEQVVWQGLRHHNEQHVAGAGDTTFAFFLRDQQGVIHGGVLAKAGRG